MKKIQPIVIGNWKMNPRTSSEAVALVKEYATRSKKITHATVVAAPPVIFLPVVARALQKSIVATASQDVSAEATGAATGEISIAMLREWGCEVSIVGHSERRARGESDQLIAHKVASATKLKQTVILCVGEKEREEQGEYFTVVENQLTTALAGLSARALSFVTIAYEPVWAIGTGLTPAVADVYEMRLFINKVITTLHGRTAAAKMRVIYGGSVNAKNAAELWQQGGIDGFLVGGASLKADDFFTIVNATKAYDA